MCIAVVDDEDQLRQLVMEVLEDDGYQVVSFGNPTPVMALHHAERHPALFIIDIMLPEMTGIELAQHLKAEGHGGTPMIAMSASRQWAREAQESHLFTASLNKPFNIDDLLDAVHTQVAA